MSNCPPGADFDSRAPWYDSTVTEEAEYNPEEDVDLLTASHEEEAAVLDSS